MCPRCREPLVAFEFEGVEIDRCVGCAGTWLDAGELETIAERAGVEPGPLSAAVDDAAGRARRTDLKCPRCRHRMQGIQMGQEPPVEIDRCRYADGLWFDAGEMEKVIASFAEGEEGAVAHFFAGIYRHDVRGAPEPEGD